MQAFYEALLLPDVISEIHKQQRIQLMEIAHEILPAHLSEMELYLLALVNYQSMSISESSRVMGISRQAAHKSARHLEELSFIQVEQSQHNKRDKIIVLTEQGRELYHYMEEAKRRVEAQMAEKIGVENVQKLRESLRSLIV